MTEQTITAEEYRELQELRKRKEQYQETLRKSQLEERKRKAGTNFYARRQTLVLRRTNQEEIAPDEDVLAYIDLAEMKNMLDPTTTKHVVSDKEIKAFVELESSGVLASEITLEMVESKKKEIE